MTAIRTGLALTLALASSMGISHTAVAAPAKEPIAYFAGVMTAPRQHAQEFVFGVTDPAVVATLRAELGTGRALQGRQFDMTVKRGRTAYNPDWNFHVRPESVKLSFASIEVCDADPIEIEDNIELVGAALLPGYHWCPWSMRLSREVAVP